MYSLVSNVYNDTGSVDLHKTTKSILNIRCCPKNNTNNTDNINHCHNSKLLLWG